MGSKYNGSNYDSQRCGNWILSSIVYTESDEICCIRHGTRLNFIILIRRISLDRSLVFCFTSELLTSNMDQITVQVKIVYNYSKGWLVLFLSFYFTSI